MAVMTTQEQLEEVQAAISRIVSGAQAYGIGTRNKREADLAVLQEREDKLLIRLKSEQGQGYPAVNIGTMRRDY